MAGQDVGCAAPVMRRERRRLPDLAAGDGAADIRSVTPAMPATKQCRTCGAPFRPIANQQRCDNCRQYPSCAVRYAHCLHPECGRLFIVRTTGLYCQPQCKRAHRLYTLTCAYCGAAYAANADQWRRGKLSCSPECRAMLISDAMTARHAAGLHPKVAPPGTGRYRRRMKRFTAAAPAPSRPRVPPDSGG